MDMGTTEGSSDYQTITSQLDGESGNQPVGMQQEPAPPQQSPEPQAPTQTQQQPGTSSNWNGQEWSLKYRDQQIIPKDRQHLISLAQQGLSYSQSMEQLKRQREQMEKEYAPFHQLQTMLQQNPALAQRMAAVLAEQQQQQPLQQPLQPQQQPQYNVPPELANNVQELSQWRAQMMEQQADQALTSEIDQLKKADPSQNWDVPDDSGMTLTYKVMKGAYDGQYPSLQAAYRDLMWDQQMTASKANALKEQAAQRQAQSKAGVVNGAPVAGVPQQSAGYRPGQSYNDLAQQATQELMGRT